MSSNKKVMMTMIITMIMLLSALSVITSVSAAPSTSTNSSGMQISTDLGNNVALVSGSIGITLPNAINKNFTESPGVISGVAAQYPGYAVVNEQLLFTVGQATGGLPPYYYSWKFLEPSGTVLGTKNGQSVYFSFSNAGTYIAESIVTDAVGNTAQTNYTVTVYNPLNIAVTASSANIYAGQSVYFTYTISGGSSVYYLSWNYGNGISGSSNPFPVPASNTVGPVTYSNPGEYLAVFEVQDAAGMFSRSTYWINVSAAQTNATIGPLKVTTLLTTAPLPSPGISSVYMYTPVYDTVNITGGTGYYNVTLLWGDGNVSYYPGTGGYGTSTSITFEHPDSTYNHGYRIPAQYIIKVYVNDSAGQSKPDLEYLKVLYVPPTDVMGYSFVNNSLTANFSTDQVTVNYTQAITGVYLFGNISNGELPYKWFLFNETKMLASGSEPMPDNAFFVLNFTKYFTTYYNTPGQYHFVLQVNDSLNNTVYANFTVNVLSNHLQAFLTTNLPYPENYLSGSVPIGSTVKYFAYLANIQLNQTGMANVTVAFDNGYTMHHNNTVNILFKGTPYKVLYPLKMNSATNQPDFSVMFNLTANATFLSAIGAGNLSVTYKIFGTFTAFVTANYGKTYNTTVGSPIFWTKSSYVLTVTHYKPISVNIYTIPYPATTTVGDNIMVFVNVTGGNGNYLITASQIATPTTNFIITPNLMAPQTSLEVFKYILTRGQDLVNIYANGTYSVALGKYYFNITYNMTFSKTGIFETHANVTDPTDHSDSNFKFPYIIDVDMLAVPPLSVTLTANSHYSYASSQSPFALEQPFTAYLNISGSALPYTTDVNFGGELLYLQVFENGTYLPLTSATDTVPINSNTQNVTSGGFYVPSQPTSGVFDSANGNVYVATNGMVYVVNPVNSAVVGEISMPAFSQGTSSPTNMIYDPANGFIYALSNTGQVYAINTTSSIQYPYGFLNFTIGVGSNPVWMAFNENSQMIYVANSGSGNVSVISAMNNTDFASISVYKGMNGIAFGNNKIFISSSSVGEISILNATTGAFITNVTWGSGDVATQLLYDSSNGYLYASGTGRGSFAHENVTVYNTVNGALTNITTGNAVTYGMQLDPSNGMIYVASSDGYVSEIKGTTLVHTTYTGGEPMALVYVPSTNSMDAMSLTLTNGNTIGTYLTTTLTLTDKSYQPVSYKMVGSYLTTGDYITSDHLIWAKVTSGYPPTYPYFENVSYDEYAIPYIEINSFFPSVWQAYSGTGISFDAMAIFGEFPNMHDYKYFWFVNGMYYEETTISAISIMFNVTETTNYDVMVIVMSPNGETAAKSVQVTVTPWPIITQVIGVRVYATLQSPGGNVYTAYAGPADWNKTGTVMASFPMPNVPHVNQIYTLNVSYSYTLGVTIWAPSPNQYMNGNGYLTTTAGGIEPIFLAIGPEGSWQTYFYNAYSSVPYATQQLTVVAGGVLLNTSTIETEINGISTQLNVNTSQIMTAISSNAYTINNGIMNIETMGSNIQASLKDINANVTSIYGNVVYMNSTLGPIQTSISNIQGQISQINGNIATIKTDVGTIVTNVSNIDAQLTSINGNIATITTTAGTISTTLNSIDGKLVAINGSVADISTSVGTIQTDINNIDPVITTIQGNTVSIQTSLGTLQGNVTANHNGIATIQTELGTMQAKLQSTSNSVSNTMIFELVVLVLVLVTLAVAALAMNSSNKLAKKIDELKKP